MNEPQPISPRRRLEELLAIPDRMRTDAEWDELNELEILLAPGNREKNQEQGARRSAPPMLERPKPGVGARGKRPPKKFHKIPPRGSTP